MIAILRRLFEYHIIWSIQNSDFNESSYVQFSFKNSWRNPSFNISTYIGFSFQKILKSGQFTCLKKRKRKLKRWFQPS